MWTRKNRARYDRSKLRYPSDLTDDEWRLVEPLIPPGKPGGGKRTVVMREVVNGLMYILSTGCQWRAIPKDLPPKSSVYGYFDLWTYDGTRIGSGSTTRFMSSVANKLNEKLSARPPPSSTAKASRAQKKGGLHRSARVRCGQRRSRARSGTFLSTRLGLLLHAIVHPADISRSRWRHSRHVDPVRDVYTPFEDALRDRNLRCCWQKFCRISTLKSSNVPIGSADGGLA